MRAEVEVRQEEVVERLKTRHPHQGDRLRLHRTEVDESKCGDENYTGVLCILYSMHTST